MNTVSRLRPTSLPPRDGLSPSQPVRWGLPDAAIGIAFTAALIAGNYLLSRAPGIPHSDPLSVGLAVLFYALIAGFLVLVSRERGLGRLARDFGFVLKWIDLLIGLGLAVAIHISDTVVYNFAVDELHLPAVNVSNVTLPHSLFWAVVYGLVLASFFGPIVEEIFFRGLVMRAVRNFVVRVSKFDGQKTTRRAQTISICVSAVIFAGALLYEARNLTMLFVLGVSVLIFGLITAAIATRTGRLGPSMIAHMLTNGLAAVALLSATAR